MAQISVPPDASLSPSAGAGAGGVVEAVRAIWEEYPRFRRSLENPWDWTPEALEESLTGLEHECGGLFRREVLAWSEEGRPIHLLTHGQGPKHVLIWAQQHGDEPLCAMALVNFMASLAAWQGAPLARAIRERLTLHIVPMVNPDGVARLTRVNAQGLDVNRDARLRQSASAQALRLLWERVPAEVAFNLHDQSPRKSRADGALIALSLQACPCDARDTQAPHVVRAKRIASVMAEILAPWIGGHLARYQADHMPRSFGDSMSRWGVSCVLIESGGWFGPPREAEAFVIRCHFLALLAGVAAVATGEERAGDPGVYDALPLEGPPHWDLAVRGAWVIDGMGVGARRADIGINFQFNPREGNPVAARIGEVGDLADARAKAEVDAEGLVATPGLIAFDPDFRPEDVHDRARVLQLLRSGITTVVGRWDAGASATRRATAEAPVHAAFLEQADLATASERHFLTEAHGWLFPQEPGWLILINGGRRDASRLVAVGCGESPRPTLVALEALFGGAAMAEILGPASPCAPILLMPTSLSRADAGRAAAAVLNRAVGRAHRDLPAVVHALAARAAAALGLPTVAIRSPHGADLLLWERASGEGHALGLGPLRRVFVAGREIELEAR